MIKKIISKTVLFIVILLFIVLFSNTFGQINTLVGVTTLVLGLSLMQRNLLVTPFKSLFLLIAFNVFLGLAAFIVNQNIWIGVVVNFGILFLIAYLFSYEVRKPLSMLIGLHYILMMAASPISIDNLPSRIIALIAGPFIIMALQIVANVNKLQKSVEKLLPDLETNILEKINLLKESKDISKVSEYIENDIKNMKITIHDSIKKDSYISDYGKAATGVLSSLERINILLDKMTSKNIKVKSLGKLAYYIKDISENDLKEITLDCLESDCEKCTIDNILEYEFIATIKTLSYEKKVLRELEEKKDYKVVNYEEVNEEFKEINLIKRSFNLNNIRVRYGIRLGLLVAATKFITDYFGLQFGTWILYTVFALTQPYAEYTVIKSKKRAMGTIIGSIIIFIVFNLVTDISTRTVLVLLSGYLMSYAVDYKNVITFVTLSAIASASLDAVSPNIFILSRLLYVAIGIALVLVANRLILRSSYKDEEIGILSLQKEISDYMFKEVFVNKNHDTKNVNNLFLIPQFIEDRIKISNLDIKKEDIYNKKVLINDIHQVYLIGNENKPYQKAMEKIYEITNNYNSKEVVEEKLIEIIKDSKEVKEKVLASKTLKIINQFDSIFNK